MKKILSLFALLLILPVFILSGCGSPKLQNGTYILTEMYMHKDPSLDLSEKINFEDYKITITGNQMSYDTFAIISFDENDFEIQKISYEIEIKTKKGKIQMSFMGAMFDSGYTFSGNVITYTSVGESELGYTAKFTKI